MIQWRGGLACLLGLSIHLFGSAASAQASVSGGGERPPNILLILIDDVGYFDLGAFGGTRITTPRMDEMALSGLKFTHFYSNGALSGPTRTSIHSGRYQHRWGFRNPLSLATQRGLPADYWSLAASVKRQGYKAIHVGKWAIGITLPGSRPLDHGYDLTATLRSAEYLRPTLFRDPKVIIDDHWIICFGEDPGTPCDVVRPTDHLTNVLTNHAMGFIEEAVTDSPETPFFMSLAYFSAHKPWQPSDESLSWYIPDDQEREDASAFCDRYFQEGLIFDDLDDEQKQQIKDCYRAMVSHVDREIGRLMDYLDATGVRQNTIVILASDNGPTPDSQGTGTYKGYKASVHEGGIRVPLIVSWPGQVPAGINDGIRMSFDLNPTIVELAGGNPDYDVLEGQSFADDIFNGGTPLRDTLFWESTHVFDDFESYAAVRTQQYKLVLGLPTGNVELYDAFDDFETNNLRDSFPEVVQDLSDRFRRWRLDISHIPVEFMQPKGQVERLSKTDILALGPGIVPLRADPRHKIEDGDFSLSVTVTPLELGRKQIIAEKPGSWSLYLGPNGYVNWCVERMGKFLDPMDPPVYLTGRRVDIGRPSQITIAADGFFMRPSGLRIYQDGELVTDHDQHDLPGVEAVRHTEETIRLSSTGSEYFAGTIQDLRVYAAALQVADITFEDFLDGTR